MGNEIQRWADDFMFTAEPLKAADGPQVYLLQMSTDPLGQIAACAKMYKGEVVRSLSDVTDDERRYYLSEMQKTKLKMPLEAVSMHFMIEGVTRSFTHQMVRQRTAAYAQESLRFAVKEDMAEGVALPPSLAGLPDDHPQRVTWQRAIDKVDMAYNDLVNAGVPAEDARGLLPHNITTRLNYITNLRSLLDHSGNRLCTQAQFEWRLVFAKIAEAVRNYDPRRANAERLNDEDTSWWEPDMLPDRWQFEEISKLFRPICYQTGKCEFKAGFDRKCSIRDRVERNGLEGNGFPSSEWSNGDVVGPSSVIHPAEWLLDPGAAR